MKQCRCRSNHRIKISVNW